jgi:large subunit ribosomal protein L4
LKCSISSGFSDLVENAIVIIEDFNLDAPKTKEFSAVLSNLNVAGKKVLFVMPENNDNVYLSLRNIPTVTGSLLADVNTYDIVNNAVLVLTESTAKIFSEEEVAA